MKIIFNLSERQFQKAMLLSGLKDAEVDKINSVLPKYQEIDITEFLEQNDEDNYAHLAFASFALGTIAHLEDK